MASKEGVDLGGDRVARAQQGRAVAGNPTASERIRENRALERARAIAEKSNRKFWVLGELWNSLSDQEQDDMIATAERLVSETAVGETRKDREWFERGQLDGSHGVHEPPGPRDGARALSEYNIGHAIADRDDTSEDEHDDDKPDFFA